MNTLYVSDLDGTLLNSEHKLSDRTTHLLNQLIEEGVLFTVATARTPATVVPLLKDINLNLPIVVMNGSFVYDIKQESYLYASQIPYDTVRRIIDSVEACNKQIFIYTLKNDQLTVYYKGFNNKDEEAFYNERKNLELKQFIKVKAYPLQEQDPVGHMVMIDSYEVIKGIKDKIKHISGIKAVMYRDVNTESGYLLEISASGMNKAVGIKYVRDQLAVDYTVAFGDNLNDLEMFKMVDCGCAVGNAVEALKVIATHVLDTNDKDSVVRFIADNRCRQTA